MPRVNANIIIKLRWRIIFQHIKSDVFQPPLALPNPLDLFTPPPPPPQQPPPAFAPTKQPVPVHSVSWVSKWANMCFVYSWTSSKETSIASTIHYCDFSNILNADCSLKSWRELALPFSETYVSFQSFELARVQSLVSITEKQCTCTSPSPVISVYRNLIYSIPLQVTVSRPRSALSPNQKLDSCCRKQGVNPICQNLCNFDSFNDKTVSIWRNNHHPTISLYNNLMPIREASDRRGKWLILLIDYQFPMFFIQHNIKMDRLVHSKLTWH